MATFPLKILTPDGIAFEGDVVSISCRTICGQVELLARHIDYCTALGMGEAHLKLEDGTLRSAACMGGMLSMLSGECRLLATTFEWADDIDKERAERSKARAEAELARKDMDEHEIKLAEARLKRALVRSSVASRRNS
ncbi:MAG TPA: ATP synthase F1 subunit epsilon [Candidatus Gemmiger excrementavium]|uniref:ATP synthase epsilon chain n=1 Tax=Candidatus Gemmiger excrementavium TaxID=2838608 RepID=A0A9D2F299_9FIRM|nr:ATP synthase F1 subunit epsilon [Candidatus Gemmiger excrementavium]